VQALVRKNGGRAARLFFFCRRGNIASFFGFWGDKQQSWGIFSLAAFICLHLPSFAFICLHLPSFAFICLQSCCLSRFELVACRCFPLLFVASSPPPFRFVCGTLCSDCETQHITQIYQERLFAGGDDAWKDLLNDVQPAFRCFSLLYPLPLFDLFLILILIFDQFREWRLGFSWCTALFAQTVRLSTSPKFTKNTCLPEVMMLGKTCSMTSSLQLGQRRPA
jgi:hypothetical protein